MPKSELHPVAEFTNVSTSGFGAADISAGLPARVGAYSNLGPTKLCGFAKDAAGGVFVKKRAEGDKAGNEVFRVVDNRIVTQVTTLCSAENLGCNISAWTSLASGVLFLRDNGGSECPDLWEGIVEGNTWRFAPLIANTSSKVKCGAICVSKDETLFAFSWNIRDPKCADIYTWRRASATSPWRDSKPVLAFQGSGMLSPFLIGSDGRLFCSEAFSASKEELFVAEIDSDGVISKPRRKIEFPNVDPSKEITFSGFEQSETDHDVFFIASNAFSDSSALCELNLAANTVRHITTPGEEFGSLFPSSWDIEGVTVVGNQLLFGMNEDGRNPHFVLDTTSWTITPVTMPASGVVVGCISNKKTGQVCFSVNSPSHPSQLFELDMNTLESTPFRVAVSKNDASSSVSRDPELISYTSFDGTKISAFMYLPPTTNPATPMPVLLYVHGGPASQYRPYYLPGNHPLSMRYLTDELGIACIAPNIRGSSGYGTAFMESDDRLKREDALKDIESLAHWVHARPEFDSHRIAIMGRSYGGWAVLASMMYFPGLFKCGLATCGMSNYLTFFQNTGPWRADHRRKEYGDERIPEEREFLIKISPALHADKIVAPLYLAIGENDTRVPVGEAVQMAETVRSEAGREVWLMVGGKEGHVFEQKSVQDFHSVAQVAFLEKFLL
ncbi:Dipeptidyl aminopeptidase [Podochytrium sp. JEL0797]|nr:Dipeptidyl aminopeptidase [Podochytrium sp. JEL0797]